MFPKKVIDKAPEIRSLIFQLIKMDRKQVGAEKLHEGKFSLINIKFPKISWSTAPNPIRIELLCRVNDQFYFRFVLCSLFMCCVVLCHVLFYAGKNFLV